MYESRGNFIKKLSTLSIILVLLLGLLTVFPTAVADDNDILLERYNINDDGTQDIYNWWEHDMYGQTFTIGNTGLNQNHMVTSVNLKISRTLYYIVDFTLLIMATSDGLPIGTPLVIQTFPSAEVIIAPLMGWYNITLDTPYELEAGKQYAMIADAASTDTDDKLSWRKDTTSPTYTGGCLVYSYDVGSSWGKVETEDLMFELWGYPISPNIVWDNGGISYEGLVPSQIDITYPYDATPSDDFEFEDDTIVNKIDWIGGYYNSPEYNITHYIWNITFYNDSGNNTPSDDIYISLTFNVSEYTETFLEDSGHSVMYRFSVNLSENYIFTGGQKYWIVIAGIGNVPPQVGWSWSSQPTKLHQPVFKSTTFGVPNWTNFSIALFDEPANLIFILSEIPIIPDTILITPSINIYGYLITMLMIGLCVIIYILSKKKKI